MWPLRGPDIQPEWKRPYEAFGLGGDLRPDPLVGEVSQFFSPWAVSATTAAIGVGGHR